MSGWLGALLVQVLHLAVMLAAAPLLAGLLRTAAARLAGRRGPHPLQPWRDLRKLLRKQTVAAEGASPVARVAPCAAVVATVLAAALVPSFSLGMLLGPLADLLLVAGLLLLARLARELAAMEAGALGGLDAARGLVRLVLAEPALVIAAMGLAMLAGTTGLEGIIAAVREGGAGGGVARLALPASAVLALAGLALAENARLPLGGAGAPALPPEAERELAGDRAAAPRDASGRHLALWEFQAALRLLVWLSLIAALALPVGLAPAGAGPLAWAAGLLAWAAKLLALGLAMAAAAAACARLPPARLPEFLAAALLVALLGVVLAFGSAVRL
ncbi:NADH-quinone oxidoreductase subunit H [Caldovatus aquaticus]|uniref:NADH-quinone oxidoreductase subunit H n=1 Tax=Caldovatus aquaticus TaxID=2865671 RepID=A0ABS7F0K0_9PROT|nr:NADH-quinone oxidoreductase subunit H [Caldovatus aquaticus]